MKKFGALLLMTIMVIGCASNSISQMRESYTYTSIEGADKENGAIIKCGQGTYIWAVDGNRKVSALQLLLSGNEGLDSIIIKDGYHSISAAVRSGGFEIGTVKYESGHEYFIGTYANGNKLHYWVEDLTTQKVVYGKKFTSN